MIDDMHRHHFATTGMRFALAVYLADDLHGVCVVGRPVARLIDQDRVAEVARLCTDGTRNACSILYAAAARACDAMGFEKIITYILEKESGSSLIAAGWTKIRDTKGGTWDTTKRRRVDKHPTGPKQRWEKLLTNGRQREREEFASYLTSLGGRHRDIG